MPRSRCAALSAAALLVVLGACSAGEPGGVPAEDVATGGPGASVASGAGTPLAAPPASSPAPPPGPAPWGAGCPAAATLPVRARLAQLLFLAVDGSSVDAVQALAGGDPPVGGVFVGGEASEVFASGVLAGLRAAPIPPLVAVDDEGGRVQRIDAVAGQLPSARELGREPEERLRMLSEERGRAMAALGITMAFAPVVDLGGQVPGAVIGDRAYGEDPATVERAAGIVSAALRTAGILPTLKHFPGHGRAVGDSHLGQAITPEWASLQQADVLPYRSLPGQGAVAVMMGHLVVPGLSTDGVPTSLDPAAYGALRELVGFDGLIVTDDLSGMRAVSDDYTAPEAARLALGAGADMALLTGIGAPAEVLDSLERDVAAGRLGVERVTDAADAVLSVKRCN